MHSEEMCAGGIDPRDDEVGTDVSLISEKMLFEHGHASGDAGWSASRQRVKLNVGADKGRCEFGIGCCSCTGTPDLGGDEMELFAVFVGNDGAAGGSCICCDLFGVTTS